MAPYHYRPPCLATTVANFDFFRVFVVLDDLERLTTATKVFAALGRKKGLLMKLGQVEGGKNWSRFCLCWFVCSPMLTTNPETQKKAPKG